MTIATPAPAPPPLDGPQSLPDGPAVLRADEVGVMYLVFDDSGEEVASE